MSRSPAAAGNQNRNATTHRNNYYPNQNNNPATNQQQQLRYPANQQQMPPPPPPGNTSGTTVTVTPDESSSYYETNSSHAMFEASTTSSSMNSSWQQMTRTLEHYDIFEQIGEGTYGQVYRGRCKDSGQIVALKKMRIQHGHVMGMPLQFIREIKILKQLRNHPNLLQMKEIVTSKGVEHLDPAEPHSKETKMADPKETYKGNLYLVLEYSTHDLTGLMDVAYKFTEVQIKCIFQQLLRALDYMHQNKYIHRDIKSSNILMNSSFQLKLADFGLARSIETPLFSDESSRSAVTTTSSELTNKVITLWYRPPEVLVGSCHYTRNVDIWSAGCILFELFVGKPLFSGKTEVEQLKLIVEVLGAPSQDTWEYLSSFSKMKSGEMEINMSKKGNLRARYENKIPATALTLLEKMLEWDPRKRLSAKSALQNRFFLAHPVAPENPADLGTIQVGPGGHFHEFQTKKKRKEAKALADEAKKEATAQGLSEKEASAEFDRVYQSLMKKVAEEGLGMPENKPRYVAPPPPPPPLPQPQEPVSDDRKSGRDKKDSHKRSHKETGKHNDDDDSAHERRRQKKSKKSSKKKEKKKDRDNRSRRHDDRGRNTRHSDRDRDRYNEDRYGKEFEREPPYHEDPMFDRRRPNFEREAPRNDFDRQDRPHRPLDFPPYESHRYRDRNPQIRTGGRPDVDYRDGRPSNVEMGQRGDFSHRREGFNPRRRDDLQMGPPNEYGPPRDDRGDGFDRRAPPNFRPRFDDRGPPPPRGDRFDDRGPPPSRGDHLGPPMRANPPPHQDLGPPLERRGRPMGPGRKSDDRGHYGPSSRNNDSRRR